MSVPPFRSSEKARAPVPEPVEDGYRRGLDLLAAGRYFEAHEAFEEAWRAARRDERDFFQSLVHVAVAWYQAQRGNRVGCERQLAKAERRLALYSPSHRGLDVAALLVQVAAAKGRFPALEPVRLPPCRS